MERRKFSRLPSEAQVNVKPVSSKSKNDAYGKNISGGGILLSSKTAYETGTLLDIEIVTPTHRAFTHVFKPFQARVRVIRSSGEKPPFDIAAEFVQISK
jgi:hypothetical protein